PHWVLPKIDRAISPLEQLAMRHLPGVQGLLRGAVFELLELFGRAMHHPRLMRELQRLGELNLRRGVRDARLRAALTPDYPLGCKRVLMSNDYSPALTRPNVTVVPAGVERVGPQSVTDALGDTHAVDTIILATGFQILDMPLAQIVRGRDGRSLDEVWQG